MRCPKCGRFVRYTSHKIQYQEWIGLSIKHVNAICAKCGRVHPNDWSGMEFEGGFD